MGPNGDLRDSMTMESVEEKLAEEQQNEVIKLKGGHRTTGGESPRVDAHSMRNSSDARKSKNHKKGAALNKTFLVHSNSCAKGPTVDKSLRHLPMNLQKGLSYQQLQQKKAEMEYSAFLRMKERSNQLQKDNVRFYNKISKIQENPSGISSLLKAQNLAKKMEKLAATARKNNTSTEFLAIQLNKRLMKHNASSFRNKHHSIDHTNERSLPNLRDLHRVSSQLSQNDEGK